MHELYMLQKHAFTEIHKRRIKKLLIIHLDSKNIEFNPRIPDLAESTIKY